MKRVMARPIRIQYAGAVCHVVARGSRGGPVYGDDADRKLFLVTLANATGSVL